MAKVSKATRDTIVRFAEHFASFQTANSDAAHAAIAGDYQRRDTRGSVAEMYALECVQMCKTLGIDAQEFSPAMVDAAAARVRALGAV